MNIRVNSNNCKLLFEAHPRGLQDHTTASIYFNIVYNWCLENGMQIDNKTDELLPTVIKFLESLNQPKNESENITKENIGVEIFK